MFIAANGFVFPCARKRDDQICGIKKNNQIQKIEFLEKISWR